MAPISDIQRQTFTEIYKTYSNKLFGICLHYVHDHDVACDLLHDSFIVIFSSLDQLRDSSRLEAWMCSIVRNIALKHLRNINKMTQISLDNILEPSIEENVVDVSEIPLDELLKIVDELPEQYGKVFRLSVLDGLSHNEIGEILGIAPHSSSSNLARAKNMLRKAVSKNWGVLLTFCLCIIAILFTVKKEEKSYLAAEKNDILTISSDKAEIMIAELVPPKGLSNLPARMPMTQTEDAEETEGTIPVDINDTENIVEVTINNDKQDSAIYEALEERHETYERRRLIFGFSGNIGNSAKTIIPGTVTPGIDMTPPGSGGSVNSGITDGTTTPPEYEGPEKPEPNTSQQTPAKHYRHAMPITFAASVTYPFSDRWSCTSGLQYTYLHSDIKEGSSKESQDIHYLGIPLKVSWTFWKSARLNAYASAGMTFEFPIIGHSCGKKIDVPCQWSGGLGVGLQYNITPRFGIYIEPEVNRYFYNESQLQTIRTERPLNITVPVGIRFSL